MSDTSPTGAVCEATALDALGQVLSSQGKHTEALALFQHSLVTKVAVLGDEVTTVANSLDNIAELYRIQVRERRDAYVWFVCSLGACEEYSDAFGADRTLSGLALRGDREQLLNEARFRSVRVN